MSFSAAVLGAFADGGPPVACEASPVGVPIAGGGDVPTALELRTDAGGGVSEITVRPLLSFH